MAAILTSVSIGGQVDEPQGSKVGVRMVIMRKILRRERPAFDADGELGFDESENEFA